MDELENDPDWKLAQREAERRDPNYWSKLNLEEIEIHLRGLSMLMFIGWAIVVLLSLILWRIW